MSSQRVVLVGGPWDGVWHQAKADQATIVLPALKNRPPATADPKLAGKLRKTVTYVRYLVNHFDGPVMFYRLSTLTDREAVVLLLAGYRKPPPE
jgi:hypothetical protein